MWTTIVAVPVRARATSSAACQNDAAAVPGLLEELGGARRLVRRRDPQHDLVALVRAGRADRARVQATAGEDGKHGVELRGDPLPDARAGGERPPGHVPLVLGRARVVQQRTGDGDEPVVADGVDERAERHQDGTVGRVRRGRARRARRWARCRAGRTTLPSNTSVAGRR
jgi:hypothetical protein